MKTKQKKLLASAGILSVLAIPAFAQEASYPVLRPEGCTQQINTPANSNAQIYFSKNCKIAYVLPRELAPLKISEFRLGANVNKAGCELVNEYTNNISIVNSQIANLEKKKIGLIDKRLQKIEGAQSQEEEDHYDALFTRLIDGVSKEIASYNQQRIDLIKDNPFSKLPGANLNLHVKLDQDSEVKAYREANPKADIQFQAARIGSGVLTFTSTNSNGDKIYSDNVIGSNFSGMSIVSDSLTDSKGIIANGGASGVITLSQPSVCNYVQTMSGDAFDARILTKENLGTAGLGVNYLYDVPVTTNVEFSIKANTKAIDLFTSYKQTITEKEFSQDDISTLIMNGTVSRNIEVTYGDGGIPVSLKGEQLSEDGQIKEESEGIYGMLFGDAMDQFMEMVIDKMKSTGMIEESIKTPVNPVQGKEVVVDRLERKCRWKTSWGRSKKKCSNFVLHDRVFIPGVASADRVAQDNSKVELNFTVNKQQTLNMRHSTGFINQAVKE